MPRSQGRRVGDPGVAAPVWAMLGYTGLLLLVFVTLQPFNPPAIVAVTGNVAGAAADTAGGPLHQVIAALVFLVVVGAAFAKRGVGLVRAVPLTLGLLFIWCMASALWSLNPDITVRRAGSQILFAVSVLISVDTLGYARAARMMAYVMLGVLVVNWISIPLIPAAIHGANETDPSLIGDWRGLYIQKNAAGAVTALTILMLVFFRPLKSQLWTGVAIMLALGFLIMTKSKTSLGLLPVAMAGGALYGVSWRNGLTRAIFLTACVLLAAVLAVVLAYNWDWIIQLFENPQEFTGRTEIWKADLAFIADHPWLGGGFGTSSDTGSVSFLQNYVSAEWVKQIGSTHNGYMDVAVNLGLVGLALTLLALVLRPVMLLWPLDRDGVEKAGFFALIVFALLHNLTESDFLSTESPMWMAFLFAVAGLRDRFVRVATSRRATRGSPAAGAARGWAAGPRPSA